jgi:hypothetical protein|tara:strand:- start:925 stop:2634 length:1710 start_codon:yes stop_codon:yes gene_type:complete
MSAEEGNDDFFKEQAKQAEKINKETERLQKIQERIDNKAAARVAYAEKMSKITEERTTKRILLDDRLQKQRRLLEVGTRMGGALGGGVGGSIFGFMQQIASMKIMDYSQKKDEAKDLDKEFENAGAVSGLRAKPEQTFLGKLDKTIDKAFGGNSKWNKMFGGHGRTAALGAGLGAVGGGLALGKQIIDSSPLLQQMLKLLQFGIMLILKPIGDFFGMIMRPVMVTLLRKFIIPYYQKFQPMMMKMGRDIGDFVVDLIAILDLLTPQGGNSQEDRDRTESWGMVYPSFNEVIGVPVGTTAWDHYFVPWFQGLFDDSTNKNPFEVLEVDADDENGSQIKSGWGALADLFKRFSDDAPDLGDYWDNIDKFFKDTSKDISNDLNGYWDNIDKFFKDSSKDVSSSLNGYWDTLTGFFSDLEVDTKTSSWVNKRWETFTKFFSVIASHTKDGSWLNDRWDSFTNFISQGLGMVWHTLGTAWGNFVSFIANLGSLGGLVPTYAADGFDGTVTRPTLFMAGERGSEHVKVTPHGQSSSNGITVNISVGNMTGDTNDLNKLRSTILEVMQTVNVNRGR